MQLALGRVQVQLQVTLAPTQTYTNIYTARERAERQLAAHSAMVARAYRRQRSRRAVAADRARWECNHYLRSAGYSPLTNSPG